LGILSGLLKDRKESVMKRELTSVVCLCLMSLLLATTAPAQQKSAVEKSYMQAREVLEAGVKAAGGLEALQAINDVTRELSGVRTDQGQGMQPVPSSQSVKPPVTSTYTKATSVRDLRGGRVMEYRETSIFGGQPLIFRLVATNSTAFFANYITRSIRFSPPPAIPSVRAGNFRRYPESLLQTAWSRPETLRWLGEADYDGRRQRVISFADADGTEVALYFDARTNLLTKSETLADDPVLGDVTFETIYSDWRAVNKVTLPFRYIDKLGGVMSQDVQVTSTTFDTHPADDLFAMPEGFAKIEPTPPVPVLKKLGEDVYALLGPYNSMFVVFKDYVLVVEAGFNDRYAQASIAEIKKIAPDKPIRYLVSTHFHFDHVSGVRSYIAEGTTIVTTPSAKTIIEQAATRTHVMRPDTLSRKPKAPVIETLTDKRVFEDGAHRVELYRISSPHVSEIIIAYFPKEKILFEGDMLDIPEAGLVPAGDDTADLANKVRQFGLQVEQIIPVHGRMGTIDDLRQAISRRTAKNQ
jgi:glyoxylase-like metal-dependent hydrolase (beta-lactamase superfamily II)